MFSAGLIWQLIFEHCWLLPLLLVSSMMDKFVSVLTRRGFLGGIAVNSWLPNDPFLSGNLGEKALSPSLLFVVRGLSSQDCESDCLAALDIQDLEPIELQLEAEPPTARAFPLWEAESASSAEAASKSLEMVAETELELATLELRSRSPCLKH